MKAKFLIAAVVIIAVVVWALVAGTASQEISIPGMTRYEDAEFGFSFWYPSAWTITIQPVSNCAQRPRASTCPGDPGWLQGGTIVKQVLVGNPQSGVVIQEFRSSSSGITELGATDSASPVGEDVTYFFDPATRTWMQTISKSQVREETPLPVTLPADVSQKTIGGLALLRGARRFGANSIVPLNASRFLVVETAELGGLDQRYLAKTIVATDPSAATRESAAVQEKAITEWRLYSENLK